MRATCLVDQGKALVCLRGDDAAVPVLTEAEAMAEAACGAQHPLSAIARTMHARALRDGGADVAGGAEGSEAPTPSGASSAAPVRQHVSISANVASTPARCRWSSRSASSSVRQGGTTRSGIRISSTSGTEEPPPAHYPS